MLFFSGNDAKRKWLACLKQQRMVQAELTAAPATPSRPVCIFLYPSIHLSIPPSIQPAIHPSIHPSIQPAIHPSIFI
jgi:hypothetical protein